MTQKELNKILLVEDEEDIRTIARIALEKIGKFTVSYCVSGSEALEKVPDFLPDLILLDVMMPGLDGIATFKALRQIPELKETPIIFMTAKVQASEIADYFKLGALDVITKPFSPITLADNLRTIWKKLEKKLEVN